MKEYDNLGRRRGGDACSVRERWRCSGMARGGADWRAHRGV